MKQVLGKLSRGSILAYSLILLGIVLVASIGMMSASVTNLKSVSSSDKSINAFQIADSGSQAVVRMLKEAAGNELRDISGVTCDGSDAVVESPANFLGGKYKAIFQDSDGKTLACNDNISAVASVKSVGTYSDTARAVQVAVAASSSPCDTPGQVVIVAKNTSGLSITPSDISKVSSFANDVSKTIVGFHCNTGIGTITGSASLFSLIGSSGFGISGNSSSSASMGCLVSGGCSASSNVCSGGWAVYGICTVDN